MKTTLIWLSALVVCTGAIAAEIPEKALTGTVTDIDGKNVDLGIYAGKVVLVVNVASRCGFTKQYAQLQALYDTYAERGLVILGFPCNQFGWQERGTELEIKAFCEETFGVTFPMFGKVDVNGDDAIPLYRYLTSDQIPLEDKGRVRWNFEKFLVGRNGRLLARYRSGTVPDDPKVVAAIEAALNAAAP